MTARWISKPTTKDKSKPSRLKPLVLIKSSTKRSRVSSKNFLMITWKAKTLRNSVKNTKKLTKHSDHLTKVRRSWSKSAKNLSVRSLRKPQTTELPWEWPIMRSIKLLSWSRMSARATRRSKTTEMRKKDEERRLANWELNVTVSDAKRNKLMSLRKISFSEGS